MRNLIDYCIENDFELDRCSSLWKDSSIDFVSQDLSFKQYYGITDEENPKNVNSFRDVLNYVIKVRKNKMSVMNKEIYRLFSNSSGCFIGTSIDNYEEALRRAKNHVTNGSSSIEITKTVTRVERGEAPLNVVELDVPQKIKLVNEGKVDIIINSEQLLTQLKDELRKTINKEILEKFEKELPKLLLSLPLTS